MTQKVDVLHLALEMSTTAMFPEELLLARTLLIAMCKAAGDDVYFTESLGSDLDRRMIAIQNEIERRNRHKLERELQHLRQRQMKLRQAQPELAEIEERIAVLEAQLADENGH